MGWTRGVQYFVTWLLAVLSVSAARAQQTVTRSYPLPEHGSIEFKIPSSWKDQVQQLKGDLPPTITWSQPSPQPASPPTSQESSQPAATAFRILLTIGWPGQAAGSKLTESDLKHRMDQAMAAAKFRSVEKELSMKELRGTAAHGYYFTATEGAPKPGEHKYVTQGIVVVDNLVVAFNIFTNDGQEQLVAQALEAIRGATHRKN